MFKKIKIVWDIIKTSWKYEYIQLKQMQGLESFGKLLKAHAKSVDVLNGPKKRDKHE